MFGEIFGSVTAGRVLVFIGKHHEGYTREIASVFGISPQMVHEQLGRFERAGLMKSRRLGNVRLFSLDSAHPLSGELLALLKKAFDSLPGEDQALIEHKRGARRETAADERAGKREPGETRPAPSPEPEGLDEFLRRT